MRMRRSSIKLSAVIAHNTDPNEITRIMSIAVSLPLPRCIGAPAHRDPRGVSDSYRLTEPKLLTMIFVNARLYTRASRTRMKMIPAVPGVLT